MQPQQKGNKNGVHKYIHVYSKIMAYQQMVGIPKGTSCAPFIADLFLFCCERDFMSYTEFHLVGFKNS